MHGVNLTPLQGSRRDRVATNSAQRMQSQLKTPHGCSQGLSEFQLRRETSFVVLGKALTLVKSQVKICDVQLPSGFWTHCFFLP